MPTVCLGAYSLRSVEAGAYRWLFLNWALGLRDAGCRVIWLESLDGVAPGAASAQVRMLAKQLAALGLDAPLAVVDRRGAPVPGPGDGVLDLPAAAEADLFLNLGYDLDPGVVRRFRRSAFVDIH